jgi:DNA-binding IclR family transcriptional regulator
MPARAGGWTADRDGTVRPVPGAEVRAVTKAGVILRAFGPLAPSLTVRQLADRTAMPRSTVHALCATLCEAGLLERLGGGGFRLGPALVELGGQVIERTGLVQAAEGVLGELVRTARTEAHLGQLVGGWVVYLDRTPAPRGTRMDNRVGLRAAAHRTGCGKAGLSRLASRQEVERRVRDACREEARPLPDLDRLHAELAAIRAAGYAVSDTFQPGRTSVAAPVLGADGQPAGAVSVAGPSAAFTTAVLRRMVRDVTAAAARIEARLTGAAGTTPRRAAAADGAAVPRPRRLDG